MGAATGGPGTDGLTDEQRRDPRFRAAQEEGGGDTGREMIAHAAQGATLSASEEKSGLDWMLGGPVQMEHTIPVDYETPDGMRKVTFVTKMIDARVIDEIQQRHVNDATGKLDKLSADIEVVAAATKYITDSTERRIELTSDEYLTVQRRDPRGELVAHKLASPHLALEYRFKGQEGLFGGVALKIQQVCGYNPERVGSAQRRLVDAALG